ncbi:MAG TPA: hypothetical protein VJ464_07745 [Blastocatellia bacterium]|nr:hypothetical protein [Blastocatellia bacterium]
MIHLSRRFLFSIFLLSLVACLCHNAVARQKAGGVKDIEATKASSHGIGVVRVYDLENGTKVLNGVAVPLFRHVLEVFLTDPQDTDNTGTAGFVKDDLNPSNFTIKYLPSGKVVPPTAIVASETKNRGNFRGLKLLQIGLDAGPEAFADPGDDQVQVSFNKLHLKDATTHQPLEVDGATATGTIINAGNIDQRIKQDYEALKNSVAHAKTDEEKDVFAGINVVIPSGGGDSQGSADISFNKDLRPATLGQASLFDHIILGFKLNKASENLSDPRHFEVGINFRKSFLNLDHTELTNITSALAGLSKSDFSDSASGEAEQKALESIANLQKNFIRAYIWDNALRFEGDVSDRGISNVSNLLWDTQLQVATVSRAFAGQTGFWNFRWVPIGFEVGGNLTNNDDPTQEKRSLARAKSGGELNLIFKAADANEPISRVTLTAKALERYLFKKEATLDEMTQKVIMTDKGSKYWLQADLKVSTGIRVGVGRVGFKVTFQRGFLPPVYNFVKTFKFGVVFETNDDDNSGNIKVQ